MQNISVLLSADMYLNVLIINNNHRKSMQLCRILNHYDPVYTHESLELANEFKDMIVEVIIPPTLETIAMVQQR
jgi:hypothetical protein